MKFKMQIIVGLVLTLLAGPVLAQSITIPTVEVAKGATANVVLGFVAGGATTNLDFTMSYDETVVDETAIAVDCSLASVIGLTPLSCTVDTTANTVKGIFINPTLTELTSGNFASIDFPVLPGAASGDSVNAITGVFSASGDTTPYDTTWTLTVLKADQTITSFTADPPSGTFGGSSELSATASSGLTVTFDSNTTPSICSVAGTTVSYIGVGTCTVTANQAGDADFNAAPPVPIDITVGKADQVINSFIATPPSGMVGGSSTLLAIASSALGVTYGSNTPGICTVAGDIVTYVTAGTCTVTANQAGDANYNPAPQVTLDISVDKADQTITGLAANPASGVVDGSSSLTATASSGLTVSFGSNTLGVCTVAGSTVSYVTAGTCTVTADQAGDANFNAAPQVTLDITVAKADQAITAFAADPANGDVGDTSTLSATGGASPNPVTFGSSTLSVCTVSGNTATLLTSGTCTVTANQSGDDNYNAAPQVTLDIGVAKADQTITGLAANPASGVVDGSSSVSATASSGLTVVFGSATPAVCTVAGTTASYVAAGTCTVTANQAGDDNYNAAPQVTLDITVAKADQAITAFAADPANGDVGDTSTLSATGGASPNPVTFGSSTLSVCTVSGNTATLLTSGTCTVTANQAGDDNYNAAPQVTLDIGVAKADQTITGLAANPASGVVDGSSSVSATASSGLTVVFGSATPAVCTVAGTTASYVAAGTCTVTANQAGDDNYNAAPQVTLDITVAKADQAITAFAADPANGDVGDTSTLSATGGASPNPVTFGSSTLSVCTVSGNTATLLTSGTCTVTANQAGDDNYNAAPQVTLDIGVAKADQTITGLAANPASGVVDGSSSVSATASSGLTVVFDSATPAVCTVAGTTASYVAAGTCTVTANQAGDDNYNAAPQVTLDITVAKADQAITAFAADPANGGVGDTSTLSATGGASPNPVTFGSSTLSVCTVSGNTATLLTSGTCTVTANQSGDDNYNAAPQVTLDIGVAKADQTITGLAANPASGVVDGSSSVSATASSGLTVVFDSATPAVCTVAGTTASYVAAGTCTVTANQAGDDNYNAAPQVTLDITVAKADQAITAFAADPANGDVGDTSTLSATGGASPNPVTFGSSTLSVCTVSGNTVTLLLAGTCTVTANQAGDDNYNAAIQVTLDIGVAKADQTITGLAADPAGGVIAGSSTLSATASSDLTVTFGSSTPLICTVTDATVSYIAAGTCTVTANQVGDDDYNAAPQVTLDIIVAKTDQVITDFAANPVSGTVDGPTSTLSATGGDSSNLVTFGSSTPAICTVSGDTVTFVGAGTCTATADQAGDDNFNAAPQVTLDISVSKAEQTITDLAADPTSGVAGGTSALSATASSGLTVAFGSSTPAVCTVAGTTVSYVAIGTCTVTANQAGDADYNAAPQVTIDITVTQGNQTITAFAASPDFGFIGSTSTLIANASSGLPVTFGSNTPAVCTVSGDTVSYLAEGICSVTADQAGDTNYTAAPQIVIDIEVTLTAPTPIPTLSQWGLLIMFLIMLGFGGLVIRRK